jgi:hypothetical protein
MYSQVTNAILATILIVNYVSLTYDESMNINVNNGIWVKTQSKEPHR